MNRIAALNERYAAIDQLIRDGATVVSVADPLGGRLDKAVRRLQVTAQQDGPGLWDELLGSAKALRWRRLSQPQPISHNPAVRDGSLDVLERAGGLRGAVSDASAIDDLIEVAAEVARVNSPVGDALLELLGQMPGGGSAVVAAGRAAQAAMERWLGPRSEVMVLTVGDVNRRPPTVSRILAIGPPRFLDRSLVTAPVSGDLSFLVPSWFGDKQMPRSAFARYAEGSIRVETRVVEMGDNGEEALPHDTAESDVVEDDYLPQPAWSEPEDPGREPTGDEVLARKLLLAGGLAIWLDDGDRIRAFDPSQPDGERVVYVEVDAVRRGTYLLLRQGTTERGGVHEAAIARLGPRGSEVLHTQAEWKARLADRIESDGHAAVVRDLKRAGISAADRARAWTDPNLVRPMKDAHFETLLKWLGLPLQPTFGYGTQLRKTIHTVSAEIREQLETAVSSADLTLLEQEGHLSLDAKAEGFRAIVATRVLAISPNSHVVARRDARLLFEDKGSRWLE